MHRAQHFPLPAPVRLDDGLGGVHAQHHALPDRMLGALRPPVQPEAELLLGGAAGQSLQRLDTKFRLTCLCREKLLQTQVEAAEVQ